MKTQDIRVPADWVRDLANARTVAECRDVERMAAGGWVLTGNKHILAFLQVCEARLGEFRAGNPRDL